MTKQQKRKIIKCLMSAVCVLFLSSGISIAEPDAKINAAVMTPELRGFYENPQNVKLEGEISLDKGNQLISVSLRDSDVKQALRMFADKAGLNIVFHNSVSGEITLDLVNVTLNDAFKMIMQMSELSYLIQNKTLLVMSSDASQSMNISKQSMSVIPVKYVDAAVIAKFLNKNVFLSNRPGLSNDEIVATNPIKNELLIFGSDNDYKMAKKIVRKLDVEPTSTKFKVNHTTPREMANMICRTLFPIDGATTTPHSAPAGENEFVLGGGVIACKVESKVESDRLESLSTNGLSVMYQTSIGAVSVVGGSQEQVKMVSDFVAKNDRKQPQAYLEFSVVELTEDGSKNFNNTWYVVSNDFSASFGSEGLASSPIFWKGDTLSVSGTSYSKYRGNRAIGQSISYLIKNGKGRILANPKLLVTNGKLSTIDLTSDYIESTTSQVIQNDGINGAVQKTYEIGEDNGIKIEVVPFISPDGYVSLNLKPEYATIKEQITDTAADGKTPIIAATLLQRRNLDLSNVRIKDGETMVIGGLIQESENQSVTKMPILGDLPIIGVFFRNTEKKSTKSELVIMITPRIVVDTEDVKRL